MPIVTVSSVPEASEELKDGMGPVVVIPVYNAFDDVVQCLKALFQFTSSEVDILIIDDGSLEPRVARLLSGLQDVEHRVVLWTHQENLGFVATANEAFRAAGRRDVVLLNSDVVVGPEWLDRLREAAYSDASIATATPLTNHGTILSVPYRNAPSDLPVGVTPESAALVVAASAGKLRPRIPTCIGHCVYIKRLAIDLVGPFDEAFSPGYDEEVDFSQRCNLAGLSHICADDVFVYHRGGSSFGQSAEVRRLQERHERLIARRYPYYHSWVDRTATSDTSVLALAITSARRALLGMTVMVDATCLGPVMMGTQRVVVETTRVLARHPRIARVIALVPPVDPPYLADAFAGCDKLELLRDGQPHPIIGIDIVYRPFQVNSEHELGRLRVLGDRMVIAQLDLIAFQNPGYFPTPNEWEVYQDLTRRVLAVADGITFLSQHVVDEAHAEGLIAPGQPIKVVYNGTDHTRLCPAPRRPALLPEQVAEDGYLLCFGTDYRHKNRLFALRVFAEMYDRGYRGSLVFAGPRVPYGSSRPEEAEYLLTRRKLKGHLVTLASVSEAEREWLYTHASLVIYPTLHEGFGLVPFEAAAAGVPCLSSAQGSLSEVLPDGLEVISHWEAQAVAGQAMALLGDEGRRNLVVDMLKRRGADFTWDRVADRLVDLFDEVCRRRRNAVLAREDAQTVGLAGALTPLWGDPYSWDFRKAVQQIGRRPRLRRLVVRITVLFYRVATRLHALAVRRRGKV